MNVYDFDNTIYDGDSTRDFIIFCMKRHPRALLYLPHIGFVALRYYLFHIGTKTQFKERMYSFLKVTDSVADVRRFWDKNITKIKPFYLQQHQDDDLIISASPEFLLKPLEKSLHISVIASVVDISTGKYNGLNCYHSEKVRRLNKQFPDAKIKQFYSDSYSDEPLAVLADEAYIVTGETVTPWDKTKHKKRLRT